MEKVMVCRNMLTYDHMDECGIGTDCRVACTRLKSVPQSYAGWQGLYFRSLEHQGRSREAKHRKNKANQATDRWTNEAECKHVERDYKQSYGGDCN